MASWYFPLFLHLYLEFFYKEELSPIPCLFNHLKNVCLWVWTQGNLFYPVDYNLVFLLFILWLSLYHLWPLELHQFVCWIWEILCRINFKEFCLALWVKEYYFEGPQGHSKKLYCSDLMLFVKNGVTWLAKSQLVFHLNKFLSKWSKFIAHILYFSWLKSNILLEMVLRDMPHDIDDEGNEN